MYAAGLLTNVGAQAALLMSGSSIEFCIFGLAAGSAAWSWLYITLQEQRNG